VRPTVPEHAWPPARPTAPAAAQTRCAHPSKSLLRCSPRRASSRRTVKPRRVVPPKRELRLPCQPAAVYPTGTRRCRARLCWEAESGGGAVRRAKCPIARAHGPGGAGRATTGQEALRPATVPELHAHWNDLRALRPRLPHLWLGFTCPTCAPHQQPSVQQAPLRHVRIYLDRHHAECNTSTHSVHVPVVPVWRFVPYSVHRCYA
jgi:hypothetical protein